MPQVQKLTDKRKDAIDKFLKDFTKEQFEQICKIANCSDFLTGKNDTGWKADFDFMMRVDKATSVLEGKYNNDNKQADKPKNASNYKQREYENLNNLYANQRS